MYPRLYTIHNQLLFTIHYLQPDLLQPLHNRNLNHEHETPDISERANQITHKQQTQVLAHAQLVQGVVGDKKKIINVFICNNVCESITVLTTLLLEPTK